MSMRACYVLSGTCLALLLAGCDKSANQPAAKAAGADVLPGTISDAMLNVDQSQSQPLYQPPPPPGTAAVGDAPSADASDASAAPEPEPAPTIN